MGAFNYKSLNLKFEIETEHLYSHTYTSLLFRHAGLTEGESRDTTVVPR